MATTAARSRQEEKLRLTAQIEEWNSNRLDLFALSLPNEELEFFGVMRFFYQDEGEKVSTKCVRVSSTATTRDVMGILIEKFRPDLRMLTRANYALYEVHVNGEERQLKEQERPLLVQLNWGKDDREGRFLLKRETDRTMLIDCTTTAANQAVAGDQSFKRKLSKREKKELKKKEKEQKIKGKENDSGVAEKLYNELPESSFTRSISNPELVMRKRRQLKLEKKLQQIRSNDGGPDSGGTLKIYGSAVNPDVPYKTLLLAVTDSVAHVVKETLEKYGFEKEDPDRFCLIQVLIPPDGPDYGKDPRERVLEDDECPLAILLQHPQSKGMIMFQLRPRPANLPKMMKKKPIEQQGFRDDVMFADAPRQSLPYLLPTNPDGAVDPYNQKKYFLAQNATEIGRERSSPNPKVPYIQLATQDILPLHCVLTNRQGVVTVTPLSKEALMFVNGTRVSDTTILRHGMTVQLGKLHNFRFYDGPDGEKGRPMMPTDVAQGLRAVTPRDFETTFDVDGRVETVRNQQATNERNQPQQMLGPDPRFGPPGYEADLLPASLAVPDEVEDKFLSALINVDNLTNIQFRMAPTYVIYMVVRSRVTHQSRSDTSPNRQLVSVTNTTNKVSQLIYQKIKDSQMNPGLSSFWVANASELLNFFKRDADILNSCLPAQDLLAEAVRVGFESLVDHLQIELDQAMPAFLNPEPDHNEQGHFQPRPSSISAVLQVLSSAMTILRRCRVNAALTIQLFSQLFHYINYWIFNRIVLDQKPHLCTPLWGQMLRHRLNQVEAWAEQQGLELAAECHLAKVLQATFLLESSKTVSDIATILSNCESLNSLQMHRILSNYIPSRGEPPLQPEVVNQLILGAQNVDAMLRQDNFDVRIDEPISLHLPFLVPEDGYSCEFIKGVPSGLAEFLAPFVQNGICRFAVNQHSRGTWMIYLVNQENLKPQQGEGRTDSKSPDSLRMEPDVFTISFSKVKNSLGLSIVAAKGEGQKERGIYVKSVVSGGGAATDGRIQAGDQLLEVDGKSLIGVSQERAAEMMSQTGQTVSLKIAKQAAMFHGLEALLSQTQQPPNPNRNAGIGKQNQLPGGEGAKLPTKSDSQPTLANTRPLSNDFRNSPKPLNQQLEAKSTPVLADPRYRDPASADMDVYASNFRSSPQAAQATRLDPMRHTSTSQPDLVNRRPDTMPPIAGGSPSNFPSGHEDLSRYGKGQTGSREFPSQEYPGGGNPAQMDDRGRKMEPTEPARQAVKPILPYQPQQPVSKKGPGYATQMLFPQSGPGKPQPPKDVAAVQGYQSNQLGSDGAQQPGYMPNKLPSHSLGYGAMGNAPLQTQTAGSAQSQTYAALQPRNQPGNVPPQSGNYLTPVGNSQQSDYRPGSEFPRGFVPPAQAADGPGRNTGYQKNSADYDFPPPPSEQHLAQIGAQTSTNHASNYSSYYSNPQAASSSAAAGNLDANPKSVDPVRFSQGDRQLHTPQFNPPVSMHGYQDSVSSYADRRPGENLTRSSQNFGSDVYESRISSSGPQPPTVKKPPPPPIAAKPKLSSVTSVTPGVDIKPYPFSPWDDKDAREKKLDEEIRMKRIEEIKRLESRPYRSPEEQSKLQRLLTEEEFDRRAQEAGDDKDSEEDSTESQVAVMRRLDDDFRKRQTPQPFDRNTQQPEPMYAKVDKPHLAVDGLSRNSNDVQRGPFPPAPGDKRQLDQQQAGRMPVSDYQRPGWQYEVPKSDFGQPRYPGEDSRRPTDHADYAHTQIREPPRSYPPNQNVENTARQGLSTPGFQSQMQYSQPDPSSAYQPLNRAGSDGYIAPVQSSQQQPRAGTVSALKQPDSQGMGVVKKSVTFNENIGVNEYTINRSYGSTSSESSFPQSPEQTTASRLAPSDQPPLPPPASYLAAIRPNSAVASQHQYEPLQSSYLQPTKNNAEPSYPYVGSEPRYPYTGQNTDTSARTAAPYRPPGQDQSHFAENDYYAPDRRYLGPSGGSGGMYQPLQPQYQGRQAPSAYSHPSESVGYGRQPQMTRDNPSEQAPSGAYGPGHGPGHGSGVVGAQEVYLDPRDRILASKSAGYYGPGMVQKYQSTSNA